MLNDDGAKLSDRMYTTRQARKLKKPMLRLGRKWEWLPLKATDRVLFWGPKGGGKSVTVYDLAHVIAKYGPVLYICAEEDPANGSVAKKASIVKKASDGVTAVDTRNIREIHRLIALRSRKRPGEPLFKTIIIDSINPLWNNSDPFLLWAGAPELRDRMFIFICQALKSAKDFRGGADVAHMCDVEVMIDRGNAVVIKNRNSGPGEYKIFEYKSFDEKTNTLSRKAATSARR